MKTGQLGPGTILGRYELLLPIASGGMATVWVARSRGSRGFSKTVAIKTILPNLSDDPLFEQMFLDEAAIASKIQHPNVAQIIDLGEQDELLYLAMEWVDGESLSTLTKFARKNGTDIPMRVGLKMMAQACAGIHAAHELRDDDDRHLELVHRDISPQNILVSSSGIVKIVDFGVAKALGRTGETSAGQLKGKVPFMSPEQAKGGKVDRRTDVFALGIILYRIATGAHPFLDENDIKTMRNIISRPVMPPRVKTPGVPVELERTILKALQKDPNKRHGTAAELETELEAVMAATGGSVPLEDVATFVRATLGERDRKRRAAIRDAALRMDETAHLPKLVSPSSQPTESVSGVMLTQTQTPSNTTSAPDSVSAPSMPESVRVALAAARSEPPTKADTTAHADSSAGGAPGDSADDVTRAFELPAHASPARHDATPARLSDPLAASSPTLAALASAGPMSAPAAGKRTRSLAIAAALGCSIGLGALLLVKLADPSSPAAPASEESRTGAAEAVEQEAVAPAPTAEAAVTSAASAQPAASDLPDQEAGTEIDVSSAADPADARGKKLNRAGPGKPRPSATDARSTSTPAVSAPPAANAPTGKPTAPPSTPTVVDPGF